VTQPGNGGHGWPVILGEYITADRRTS